MTGSTKRVSKQIANTVFAAGLLMTFSNTAYADTVAGYLSVSDWYMIISTETGAPVILQQSASPSHWMSPRPVSFNLSFTKNNLASRYLYIIAASTPNDGAAPLMAGVLSGSKTILTGNTRIKVLSSSYDSANLPNLAVIDELIKGELGGNYQSTYNQPKFLIDHINFSAAARTQMSGAQAQAIWGNPAVSPDNGSYVVFRIPYSALFNPPVEDAPPPSSSGGKSGATVPFDVGGLIGSLFGNKDKDKAAPKETTQTSEATTSLNTGPVATTQDSTSSGITAQPTEGKTVYITQPPTIIKEYIADPDLTADRDQLRDSNIVMEKVIRSQTEMLKERDGFISDLQTQLGRAQNGIASVPELLAPKDETIARQADTINTLNTAISDTTEKIDNLQNEMQDLKNLPKPLSKAVLIGGGLGGLGLGALAGLMIGRRRHNKTCDLHLPPLKREEEEKDPKDGSDLSNLKKGMAFGASPMALGGLPMSLAAIKPVYDAVGRIGFAQEGKPTGEEDAFGTGILISDIHVLTNRHVWEMFKDRLAGDQGAGIEFHAEKDKDKTDFIAFDGAEPVCIHGQDAAIFTLSRKPEARAPVTFAPRPMKQLNDLEVVVVGYPQAHRMTPDIAAVTEDNPIFGVKRYSEGKIFRHSTDIDTPYGVEAAVSEIINPARTLRAICHNASTLGGSSGSAVICKKTGDLVALHFGYDTAYDWEEATNFAIAGDMLAEDVAKIIGNV